MNADRLIIRDFPVALWLVGTALLGSAAYLFLTVDPITAGIDAVFGLAALLLPAALTVTADREARVLTLRYGLILPRAVKEIPFHEIAAIQVGSSRSSGRRSGRRRSYRIELVKMDGAIVPFRSYYSSGSYPKELHAGKLRDFIGLNPR
jgi:hypothetical protein